MRRDRHPVEWWPHRVAPDRVENWIHGDWRPLAEGTSISAARILRVPLTRASRVRLSIVESAAAPVLREFGLYAAAPL